MVALAFPLALYYDRYKEVHDMALVLTIVAALAVVYGAFAVYLYYGYKRKMAL